MTELDKVLIEYDTLSHYTGYYFNLVENRQEFRKYPAKDKLYIRRQLKHMQNYKSALEARIEYLKNQEETTSEAENGETNIINGTDR